MSAPPQIQSRNTISAGSRPKLGQIRPGHVGAALRLVDLALICMLALVAYRLALGTVALSPVFWFAVACASLVALDLFAAAEVYRPRHLGSILAQGRRVGAAWTVVQALLVTLATATGSTAELPWRFFLLWWAVGASGFVAVHAGVALVVGRAQRSGRLATRLVLVGAGPQAGQFIRGLRQYDPAVVIAGIFDDRRSRVPASVESCPVLGSLDELASFIRIQPIDQIVITLPQHAANRRLACLERLRHLPIDVRLSPDLPGLEFTGRGTAELGGMPLLRVFDRPLAGSAWLAKAVEDRVLAAIVLLLAAPLMLVLAGLVRAGSPGPVLYRQRRYGFDNRPIEILKFRTMYAGDCADGAGQVVSAQRHDRRVTPIGRFLRKTSLDELPQFLNVLRGEMSVVGPRPHALAHHERYAGLIDGYLARHRVRPGITGWAQVNGLRGGADTLARMQERVRYDLHYIENWSLLLDLRIILRTLLVGFSHPNAY